MTLLPIFKAKNIDRSVFMNIKRKNIELSILFGLIFAILLSFTKFDAVCSGVRENVVRLHIIANSNSEADQELKLKIRDEILKINSEIFENTER